MVFIITSSGNWYYSDERLDNPYAEGVFFSTARIYKGRNLGMYLNPQIRLYTYEE